MKKKNDYFEMLGNMIGSAYEAATLLKKIFNHFDYKKIQLYIEDMHDIENRADEQLHDFVNKLATEFITPIERNDLLDLAGAIDNVTDSIDDILLNIYMYNIKEIVPQSIEFANALIQSCEALKSAFGELHDFRKSKKFHRNLVEVNRIESEMDMLYVNSVRDIVISESKDPIEVMTWIKIFEKLENCCDSCETLSLTLESAAMRNS